MAPLFFFISTLSNILAFAVFIRALLTWIPGLPPSNPLVMFFTQITEPVLQPLRRVIPPIGMIDITPLVAIILLQLVAQATAVTPF